MTLDPVHRQHIAALAADLRPAADEDDHRALAAEVWEEYLDPLYGEDGPVLEPLDDRARYTAPITDLGVQEPAFETVHGLDSGTINPRTFRNGLVLDLAQAAMAADPSDLDLHRSRTIVKSVHSNDVRHDFDRDWEPFDEGYGRTRVVQVGDLARDQERVVHGLSLYLAESSHALRHADAVSACLLLDGPVYPKQLVTWAEQHAGLRDIVADEPLVGEVVRNYTALVERFAARSVPIVGVVKSGQSNALLRALNAAGAPTPWASDRGFFTHVLEQRDDGERRTEALSWTSWFVSRLGADGTFASVGPTGDRAKTPPDVPGLSTEEPGSGELGPTAYEVTFFVVYDPRTDVAYRIELPRAFAADERTRERVRRQVIRGIAARSGPPEAVARADSLARISRDESEALVSAIEEAFDSDEETTYDDLRWDL
ncbi:MAG: DNA double-strand break repair nuclease NurA [Halobacteriaceae archaeon]